MAEGVGTASFVDGNEKKKKKEGVLKTKPEETYAFP